MRRKTWLIMMLAAFMGIGLAQAESFDYSDDRRGYAQAISALSRADDGLTSRAEEEPTYTLVLFKLSQGEAVFQIHQPVMLIAGPHGCYTAAYPDEEQALQAIAYLKTLPNVQYAELDGEVTVCEAEYSFHSDGAQEMGFSHAAQWCKEAGEGTVSVAVVDSGVYRHPLLVSRLTASGFDYVDGDADATSDTNGHGTHVAGIVADCTPSLPVYIKPIRVLNAAGKGTLANTTSAVYEAAEAGCEVINLSLVSSTHSEALEEAVQFAADSGTAVVISAGNFGANTSKYCPVHMEDAGVIVVGACTGDMERPLQADYSNFGSSVDVYAFGSSISSCSLSGGYTAKSGTSQAAPHVSALCSVMKLLFPALNGAQIETRIKQLSGDSEANVPNAALLKPQTFGVSGGELYLLAGTSVTLMKQAEPAQSFQTLRWSCEDPSVARVDDSGVLRCLSAGTTVLQGKGSARAKVQVTLHVTQSGDTLRLPQNVARVEDEAFAGVPSKVLFLPRQAETVASSAFGQLNTVFYDGSDPGVIGSLTGENVCFVVNNDRELWSFLEEERIPYIVDCGSLSE